jgi:hypothetical protein
VSGGVGLGMRARQFAFEVYYTLGSKKKVFELQNEFGITVGLD